MQAGHGLRGSASLGVRVSCWQNAVAKAERKNQLQFPRGKAVSQTMNRCLPGVLGVLAALGMASSSGYLLEPKIPMMKERLAPAEAVA